MTWQPRNEFVLCRLEKLAVDPSALAYPDQSIQSKRLVVVALGSKVEGLAVGDEVLANAHPEPRRAIRAGLRRRRRLQAGGRGRLSLVQFVTPGPRRL